MSVNQTSVLSYVKECSATAAKQGTGEGKKKREGANV